MSRVSTKFAELKGKGLKAFIPFLMAGDPSLELTKDLVLEAEKKGADLIELGIPFSNPLADGPTIRKAAKRSLGNGTNLTKMFKLVENIRKDSQIPIILMGYYNSIYAYGLARFVESSEEAGVDGVIIPDLPLGEDQELRALSNSLDIISLVTLNSSKERIKEIAANSQGFIYAVASIGTTGARAEVSTKVKGVVEEIQSLTATPVAVGFGISKAEHVEEVGSFADGVIVGSAIIKSLEDSLDLISDSESKFINGVGEFINKLSSSLK